MDDSRNGLAISRVTSSDEFFRDCLIESAKSQHVELEEHVEFYLVKLLSSYLRSESDGSHDDLIDKPLAIMLKEAVESPESSKMVKYKKLGDKALYLSGFFRDYFINKCFSQNYYISMGKNAYQNTSVQFNRLGDRDFYHLYIQLADDFEDIVGLFEGIRYLLRFEEVKSRSLIKSDQDLNESSIIIIPGEEKLIA